MMYRRSMTFALLVFALPGLQAAAAAQTARPRKEITLPAATLAQYVGTYELAPGKNLAIRLDGSQLNAQLPGQGPLPIFPESETRFFLKVADTQLEFGKDAAGAVTHVVLRQNGVDQKGMRTRATAPPPEPPHKETTVPVSTLSKYPGTYELRANSVLTVTLEGDHLMPQLTGQRKFPIFPESATVFFYKNVKATLEFQQDGRGKTTGVRLKQGTVDQVLPKK